MLGIGSGLYQLLPHGEAGTANPRATALTGCTTRVSDAATMTRVLATAVAGDRVCLTADLPAARLTITRGGAEGHPITIVGNGHTVVKGITVEASNVIVGGFDVLRAAAPGISITGANITVENNTVLHPTGDDYDGLRFFGTNLKILNNTITDINPDGSDAHADCMQTFATDSDSPASQDVLIEGNRCDKIDNQCLIAEGPNASAGDGSGQGTSANITFSHNYCNVVASQATEIDDVQHVKMLHNDITGTPDKAFSFQNNSTGAVVTANKLAPNIGYEVGMDTSSQTSYKGPKVGGEP